MSEDQKPKDLTSLVDLAEQAPDSVAPQEGVMMDAPPPEQVSEADFGNLEELSRSAVNEEPAAAVEGEPALQVEPPAPEASPSEFAGGLEGLGELPSLSAFQSQSAAEPQAEAAPQPDDFGSGSDNEGGSAAAFTPLDMDSSAAVPPVESVESAALAPPEPVLPDAPVLPEPVVAAPPSADHVEHGAKEPLQAQNAMESVRAYGEKFAIGQPRIEASPPFSFFATFAPTPAHIARIKDVLTAEDFGVTVKDIEVQLRSGKLLVPKISEFAAVTLGQKLREIADDVQLGLSTDIFKAKATEASDGDFDNVLFDSELFQPHGEEVRDLGAEPQNERDLFTTHLHTIEGHRITRILSALTVSKVVGPEVAENPGSNSILEDETEKLTAELITKAYKLGAHGVVGMAFTLKAFEVHTALGKKRAYRLWGTGTAVRMHRTEGEPQPGVAPLDGTVQTEPQS